MKASGFRFCRPAGIALILYSLATGVVVSGDRKSISNENEVVDAGGIHEATHESLETRSYHLLPRACTFGPRGTGARPKQILEFAGITFGAGSDAHFDSRSSLLTVRNTPEQFELIEAYIASLTQRGERQVAAIIEFIEVDVRILSDWIFENRLATDGTPLRKMLQNLVREGSARVVETSVINCRSGQRAKTESVSEFIYTSELEQQDLPESVNLMGDGRLQEAAVNVTAMEYRYVGVTTEVDAVIGADEVTLDLSLSPGLVAQGERTIWPNAEVNANSRQEMPGFHHSQIATQVTLLDGHYAFLGTLKTQKSGGDGSENKALAIFVRGDISRLP